MTYGLQEAENNGLRDIKLCLHYMDFSVRSSDDFDLNQRLLSMNKLHLVVLSVVIDDDYVDKDDDHQAKLYNFIKEVISVHSCSQLQHLALNQVNLGEHKLVLPDNITHIKLLLVTITEGLSVHKCSQLQHLDLDRVDIGEHKLVLPDNITHIKLSRVAITGGLSVQHCTQLQHLALGYLDLGEHGLVLPDNITYIELWNVAMTGGLLVQHCSHLQKLTLFVVDLGKHELVLPANIIHINLFNVTMVGGLLVQHCSQLQDFALWAMKFDDDFSRLPNSITNIALCFVTMSVRNLLALLEYLENLPHAVSCELKYCTVEPSSEHGQVEHRLKTLTILHCDYNIDGTEDGVFDEKMCFTCWK